MNNPGWWWQVMMVDQLWSGHNLLILSDLTESIIGVSWPETVHWVTLHHDQHHVSWPQYHETQCGVISDQDEVWPGLIMVTIYHLDTSSCSGHMILSSADTNNIYSKIFQHFIKHQFIKISILPLWRQKHYLVPFKKSFEQYLLCELFEWCVKLWSCDTALSRCHRDTHQQHYLYHLLQLSLEQTTPPWQLHTFLWK